MYASKHVSLVEEALVLLDYTYHCFTKRKILGLMGLRIEAYKPFLVKPFLLFFSVILSMSGHK